MLDEIVVINEALRNAQEEIQSAQELFTQTPGLITPAVEKQVHNLYVSYAKEFIRLVQKEQDIHKRAVTKQTLQQERAEDLYTLWHQVLENYLSTHPEFSTEQPQTQP